MIGSIPFAVVVSWIMRLADPRTYGSSNPGATNVLRSGNKLAALLAAAFAPFAAYYWFSWGHVTLAVTLM